SVEICRSQGVWVTFTLSSYLSQFL
ncbi:hypothetical protein A2U01_0092290, partial [Trifolium medium]|nr:hypothetical protein [Trifolium medium]